MSLNYTDIQKQVRTLGEGARLRAERLQNLRERAAELLESHANELEQLRYKAQAAARIDPGLRCALPVEEALNARGSLPELPATLTILAADGSQIAPNRHEEVEYSLVNVGVICLSHGSPQPPTTRIDSLLLYDESLYTESGALVDVALLRDLRERAVLADLAEQAAPPVITLTDGPVELWGAKDDASASQFSSRLADYQKALRRLSEVGAATAGYVDKPAANLVVRLLEIAMLPEDSLGEIRNLHPLRGVLDLDLFRKILQPGERSALFAMQSKSASQYQGELELHFFYLNVGLPGKAWIARVEVPRWVARAPALLNNVHAALVSQARILGSRPYPYLLHRAHEAAVVGLDEHDQVTNMILLELRRRGVPVGERSYKQTAKDASRE
jgi:hypothetical protein